MTTNRRKPARKEEALHRADIEAALWAGHASLGIADDGIGALPEGRRGWRRAAVLCPIVERTDGMQMILTLRPKTMRNHAGQVAFPGGKIDVSDSSPMATALREAEEEIGLSPQRVDILGTLPAYRVSTGFEVTPFVGFVDPRFRPFPNPDEVAEVFEVPLDFLLNAKNFQRRSAQTPEGRKYFYAIPYGRYVIWGATAGMLKSLADRLRA